MSSPVRRPDGSVEVAAPPDGVCCSKCEDAMLSGENAIFSGVGLVDAMLRRTFIVCSSCGNKRCPKATNHELACTESNASGQPGSRYE